MSESSATHPTQDIADDIKALQLDSAADTVMANIKDVNPDIAVNHDKTDVEDAVMTTSVDGKHDTGLSPDKTDGAVEDAVMATSVDGKHDTVLSPDKIDGDIADDIKALQLDSADDTVMAGTELEVALVKALKDTFVSFCRQSCFTADCDHISATVLRPVTDILLGNLTDEEYEKHSWLNDEKISFVRLTKLEPVAKALKKIAEKDVAIGAQFVMSLKYDEAEFHYSFAVKQFLFAGLFREAAATSMRIGQLLEKCGKKEAAVMAYLEAAECFESTDGLTKIECETGAQWCLLQALDSAEKFELEPCICGTICKCLADGSSDPENRIEYYERAIMYYEEGGEEEFNANDCRSKLATLSATKAKSIQAAALKTFFEKHGW